MLFQLLLRRSIGLWWRRKMTEVVDVIRHPDLLQGQHRAHIHITSRWSSASGDCNERVSRGRRRLICLRRSYKKGPEGSVRPVRRDESSACVVLYGNTGPTSTRRTQPYKAETNSFLACVYLYVGCCWHCIICGGLVLPGVDTASRSDNGDRRSFSFRQGDSHCL